MITIQKGKQNVLLERFRFFGEKKDCSKMIFVAVLFELL